MVVMEDISRYYRVLDLEPGASEEEVNQAYKDLAFIWHPDRIPKDNERLQQKALAKLQEINLARERLRSLKRQNSRPSQPPTYHQQRPERTYYYRQPSRPPETKTYNYQQPPRPPETKTYNHQQPSRPPETKTYNYQQPYRASQAREEKVTPPKSERPDSLTGANLQGVDYKEKDLSNRNLKGANLKEANLSDTFLHRINLEDANLEKANLFRANLLEANLKGANLRDANLIGADFSGANLSGADLRGAKVGTNDRLLIKLTGTILTGTILPDGSVHT